MQYNLFSPRWLPGSIRGGGVVQPVHRSGAQRVEGHVNLWRALVIGVLSLSKRKLVFATIFSLFRKIIMYNSLVTALYKVYVIWTFCCTGKKHLWKFTSGFIGLQIFNFERSLNLSPGPPSSLIPPGKMSLGVMMAATLHFESPSKHIQILSAQYVKHSSINTYFWSQLATSFSYHSIILSMFGRHSFLVIVCEFFGLCWCFLIVCLYLYCHWRYPIIRGVWMGFH